MANFIVLVIVRGKEFYTEKLEVPIEVTNYSISTMLGIDQGLKNHNGVIRCPSWVI